MAFRSTAGCNLAGQRPAVSVLPLAPRLPRVSRQCHSYQQSQASNALHQSQQQQGQPQQQNTQSEQERHHIDPNEWDMNYWHYQPWWLQPHTVIATGIAFFLAMLAFDRDEPMLKSAIIAAGPVVLYYFIFLFLLPRTFKNFAVEYIETHPEVEELAHQEEQQQQ